MLTIGALARLAGVAPSAVRYYEKAGLLPRAERRNGRRVYGESDLLRLRLIVAARTLGWSIGELRGATATDVSPEEVLAALANKRSALAAERDAIVARIGAIDALARCGCSSFDRCAALRR